jgi:hypothetical protein
MGNLFISKNVDGEGGNRKIIWEVSEAGKG